MKIHDAKYRGDTPVKLTIILQPNFMQNFNKLSRAEMRNVLGGTMPIGGDDCSADCVCSDGTHMTASLKNCDKDTCSSGSTGVDCKIGGVQTSRTCVNVCPAN